MAHLLADRIKETTTTTGTGNITLAGAVAGFRAFSAVLANNDTTLYAIVHQTPGEWEVGVGTWLTGGTLVRTTLIASSTGSAVSFSAGTKDVFITGSPTGPQAFSNYINLAEITEPAAPQSQSMRVYAEDRLGRTVLRAKTPGGNRFQLMQDNVLVVRNETGVTIPIFSLVYESGTGSSGEPLVALAKADSTTTMPVLGITAEGIANNANGFVMILGIVTDVNTSPWSSGDILYASPTVAGGFTTTKPTGPDIIQRVARVLASHATLGTALIQTRGVSGGIEPDAYYFDGRSSLPVLPDVGDIALFSLLRGGRPTINVLTGSGRDYALQPWLATNKMGVWTPNTTTTVNSLGLNRSGVGTVSHPTPTTTNLSTSIRRWRLTSAATANAAAEDRSSQLQVVRGNAAGVGGFTMVATVIIGSATALQRGFFGLMSATGATATTANPSALTNIVAFMWDSSETTLRIGHNDASGACTRVDLGANFPTNVTTAVYRVMLFCRPNDDRIRYFISREDTGDTTDGELTTDIPANTQFLTPHLYMNNGGTAAAVFYDCSGVYIESDY